MPEENLILKRVKKDLKNIFESPAVDQMTKIMTISDTTKWLLSMDFGDENKNIAVEETIKKYYDEQEKQENALIKAQSDIWANAENLYNHIMTEL